MIFLVLFEYKMPFFSTQYFLNDEISNFFDCRFDSVSPPYTLLSPAIFYLSLGAWLGGKVGKLGG